LLFAADRLIWTKLFYFKKTIGLYLLFPFIFNVFYLWLSRNKSSSFDLPEAEAELVSGYNVEYSAMGFALFSLGEYANMLMMSSLNVILFFGGWLPPMFAPSFIPDSLWFGIKICFLLFYLL